MHSIANLTILSCLSKKTSSFRLPCSPYPSPPTTVFLNYSGKSCILVISQTRCHVMLSFHMKLEDLCCRGHTNCRQDEHKKTTCGGNMFPTHLYCNVFFKNTNSLLNIFKCEEQSMLSRDSE